MHLKLIGLLHNYVQNCKAEVATEESSVAFSKALRLASLGLVVSVGRPSAGSPEQEGGKKKLGTETVCKEKNTELAR